MNPAVVTRNFTPSSTDLVSFAETMVGTAVGGQIVQGHCTVTLTVIEVGTAWRLPMSSTARTMMATGPEMLGGAQSYCQLVSPVAWNHRVPPSKEISMPATTPPPVSAAVPWTVTVVPPTKEAPVDGLLIAEVGGAVSVDWVAGTRPGCSVTGWQLHRSAKRFTVACCMSMLVGVPG